MLPGIGVRGRDRLQTTPRRVRIAVSTKDSHRGRRVTARTNWISPGRGCANDADRAAERSACRGAKPDHYSNLEPLADRQLFDEYREVRTP